MKVVSICYRSQRMSRNPNAQQRLLSLLSKEGRETLDLKLDAPLLASITAKPSDLLWRLQQKGLAHRIQVGRYLISTNGEASPFPRIDRLEPLASLLLQRLNMPYLVSWHSALWAHNLIDQQ